MNQSEFETRLWFNGDSNNSKYRFTVKHKTTGISITSAEFSVDVKLDIIKAKCWEVMKKALEVFKDG